MLLLNNKTIDKLKYDFVREGLIDLEALNCAQENAEKNSTNLSVELIKEKIISEKELLNFIQNKLHIPYVELSDYTPDTNCLKYINVEEAKKYNILPLFMIEDVLTIAMSDPLDLFAINTLFENKNFSIEPVVCAQKSISDALEYYYGTNYDTTKSDNWQEIILSGEIDDNDIKQSISLLFKNAIDEKYQNIFWERTSEGIQVYFGENLKGFIPNILAQKFINVMAADFLKLTLNPEDIPIISKFNFNYKNSIYIIPSSFLPTRFGTRIAFEINRPLKELPINFVSKLFEITSSPSIIKIKNEENDFLYSIAKTLSQKYKVLMAELCVRYNLENVVQLETGKNTGLYFDEILKQLEFQKFDVVFWEKIYSQEQFDKLKLLSKEKTIFTKTPSVPDKNFDFIIDKDKII